jgi:hypothetical protein
MNYSHQTSCKSDICWLVDRCDVHPKIPLSYKKRKKEKEDEEKTIHNACNYVLITRKDWRVEKESIEI